MVLADPVLDEPHLREMEQLFQAVAGTESSHSRREFDDW
jgi:hypothetical protein